MIAVRGLFKREVCRIARGFWWMGGAKGGKVAEKVSGGRMRVRAYQWIMNKQRVYRCLKRYRWCKRIEVMGNVHERVGKGRKEETNKIKY
jgi:hypothetical protein